MRFFDARLAAIVAAGAVALSAPSVQALTWNVTYGSGLAAGTPERIAFDQGLAFWASKVSDPITVPFTANFGTTSDANLLGGTLATYYSGTSTPSLSYTSLRTAMINDAADESDDAITASLPTSISGTALKNSGKTVSSNVDLTRTNARALGLVANTSTGTDGDITFYNKTYYDFDRGNGVTSGKLDFYSTVVHELGHLMGFVSVVDDSYYGDTTLYANPLDLYRFSGNSGGPTTAAAFGTTARDFRYSVTSHFDDTVSKFAMDNASTNQASHWLEGDPDNGPNYIGVMDPIQSDGVVDNITYADYRAFDLIGWDINAAAALPEPASLAVLGLGGLLLGRRRSARGA